jgi:hypothetical protein
MAHLGVSRILAAKGGYPVQGSSRGPGSLYENVGYLDHERTSSVRQRTGKKEGNERQCAPPAKIVVVEQWICFVLGFVCMTFGVWGICMEPGQDALSAYIAWLGSLYIPTLRVTAVVCLGLGVMLARRGWAHL